MDQSATLQSRIKGFFPDLLGVRFVESTADRVLAELPIRDELCTVPGILHGGAVMAFADTVGAFATVLNLPAGARTTTLESKTNFFGPGRSGTTITAEALPLHRGKHTMVWQTSIRSPEGRLLAQVTQTQYVDHPA